MESKQKSTKVVQGSEKRKPPNAGSGRAKGSLNKNTKQLKDMILKALDGVGGVEYLQERATDPKTAGAFLGLIGKVLPMTIVGDADNPIAITTIERVIVRPKHTNA